MQRLQLRTIPTLLFAALFALASLGHAPSLMLAFATDCHGSAPSSGSHALDGLSEGPIEHVPHHPAGMPIGCPLANLPPPPAPQAIFDSRDGVRTDYATGAALWPPSADIDRLDPPPRRLS
jgi:hypothetical protein